MNCFVCFRFPIFHIAPFLQDAIISVPNYESASLGSKSGLSSVQLTLLFILSRYLTSEYQGKPGTVCGNPDAKLASRPPKTTRI